jgi:hypothetical protein
MAIAPEPFNGTKLEKWGYTAQTADHSADVTQIVNNNHVDLRTFEGAITEPRVLSSINDLQMGTLGDINPATLDETFLGDLDTLTVVPGEPWVLTSTTGIRQTWTDNGVSATNYLYVGNLPNRSNWRGAKMITDASAPLNVTLESAIPTSTAPAIDISLMDYLCVTFPNITPVSMNEAVCYIQITSAANGTFGAGSIGKVFFSRETALGLDAFAEEIRLPISEFANDPSIDLTAITGVRIHVQTTGTPANNSALTVMAVRAIQQDWEYHTLDFNTKSHRYVMAVSPRGLSPTPLQAFYPLVRTDTVDPTPTDSALLMSFNTGLLTASGSNFNQIDLIFREQTDSPTDGSCIIARLEFNATTTKVSYFLQTITGGVQTTAGTVLYQSGTTNGPPLLAPTTVNSATDGWYLFKAQLQNSTITTYLYSTDSSGLVPTTPIWSNAAVTVSDAVNFPPVQGRVGWFAHFNDFDVQLDEWEAAATAFSSFTTKVFASHTPVDGAQLVATYSGDNNLFSFFSGADTEQDSNRTLSGSPSWAASTTMESNIAQIDDWTHTYLDFDIFTPSTMTTDSQPVIYVQQVASGPPGTLVPLLSSTTQQGSVNPRVLVEDFTYGQWTHVTIPLTQVADLITGNYHFVWAPLAGAETTTWWIDNMKIGRQTIEWEVKARADIATWRPFGIMVNDPNGAVHFPRSERGTELQLQCRALTEDAWVSNYTLKPHYAQLGRPVYYNGRVTDG